MNGRDPWGLGGLLGTSIFIAVCVLAGCSGDTGARGPAGPTGPAGPAGPPGPSGAVPVSSAEQINVAVTGVTVPAGGGAPVVELELTNDAGQGLKGLPAANIAFAIGELSPGVNGGSSEWQSYVTRADGGVPNVQATTETATEGTYVDNLDGTYRYTFSKALTAYPAGPTYSETATHRLGVEIRTSSGGFLSENIPANNAPYDFVPTGGAPTVTRLIAGTATCNGCHQKLEVHGEARFDVEYCVLCHNPHSFDGNTGNSVDMKVLIHKIHDGINLANGYQIVGFGGSVNDFSDVEFPQDIRNCQVCHNESDPKTPQASNWRMVANRAACGTCHDDIDWANGGHPGGFTFTDDTQCLDCHGPNGTVRNAAGKLVQTPIAHEIPALLASAEFAYNVLDVTNTNTGQFPTVTFSVTNPLDNDTPYDLANDPAFTACDGTSRLAIDIAWSTAEFTNRDSGSAPSQPVSISVLPGCGDTVNDNLDGTYSATSSVAVPATVSGSLSAALEGHPWKDLNADGLTSQDERIAVTNAIRYAAIGTAPLTERRSVVDIAKCDKCHKQLSLHGGNRTDNPQVCVGCHNPNATDIARRTGQCLATLGADDTPIDFKRMIHAIHASGTIGVPFEVCGFAGANVFDFVYPGRLNNCEGCHKADTYYPVDGSAVHGTTADAGTDVSSPTDDTVISPNAAVCSACHTSDLAKEHMEQNGGDFAATKAADSALISAGVETCGICHGPGRVADVKVMHGVESFVSGD
jgi:OmcA/MtrC family decaheme c-type cytochrome